MNNFEWADEIYINQPAIKVSFQKLIISVYFQNADGTFLAGVDWLWVGLTVTQESSRLHLTSLRFRS